MKMRCVYFKLQVVDKSIFIFLAPHFFLALEKYVRFYGCRELLYFYEVFEL